MRFTLTIDCDDESRRDELPLRIRVARVLRGLAAAVQEGEAESYEFSVDDAVGSCRGNAAFTWHEV